jgi:hypothetical protein
VERISFNNGKSISSAYLNEVQKGDKFDGDTRTDYYASPTSGDEAGWEIGQRDSLKDWEISDPRVDIETSVGRTAHDGIVLGWNPTTSTVVVPGTPSVKSVGSGNLGVEVEAGTFITRSGQQISWPRQTVQILPGANVSSYLFIREKTALEDIAAGDSVTISMGASLPSVSDAHIPLAKLKLNTTGTALATDSVSGEVFGNGYIDLRPNTFIGNLNTYPQNLTNTAIKTADYTASAWERVIADTSNGSIIVTLPENPSDSDRFAVVDISGTFDRFPLIIRVNPVSVESLNDSQDDWIVNIRDSHLELFYNTDTNQWKFEQAPGSECNPVLGSFLSCGGREFIGDRVALECPDGKQLPARYPEPSPGVYSFEPSQADPGVGKCYKVYNSLVALYANGTGGLISVTNAPRCDKTGQIGNISTSRNVIYVDPSIGNDSVDNSGSDTNAPFRTIERAIIEAVRESRRSGTANDRYDRVMIELAPGDYYVDNSPGSASALSITEETGLIQRTATGLSVGNVVTSNRLVHITVDVGDPTSTQPPTSLNLGRVLYNQTGSVGNIARIEKQSLSSSNWIVTLEYVNGVFTIGDSLYYDNLAAVNPSSGGIIVPRGISLDGTDLRKVRIRPMYVPELTPVQNDPQTQRTSILKVTGGTYVSSITYTDNPQYARSHNTVTSVTYASQAEIFGAGAETSYYSRLNNLFTELDGWGSEGLEALVAETTIVATVPGGKENRAQDIEENQTGLIVTGGDSRTTAPIAYPGATRIRDTDGSILPLPDVNSTRSSSPYIFNCSVRSIFGLNGLWANGALVSGFKSMVTANFTQVSLQTDPNCFNPTTYYQDPPINKETGSGKQYKTCTTDLFKYRHFGMRGSNDATIQIVSVFVIGNSDHYVADNGSDLSITNSCSDFGDISLRSIGFKQKSFSQDEKTTSSGYNGTRVTKIIPPLPLSYNTLPNGHSATLEDTEINTGLTIDYEKTLVYTVQNKTPGGEAPETIRIYIRNSNTSSPFTLTNVPSAKNIAFGQFTYTKKVAEGSWELSGGPYANRKRIYVNGFDELGNSILYTGNLKTPDPTLTGFANLEDSSKIFAWDPSPQEYDVNGNLITSSTGSWYIPVTTTGITEETTDLDNDGFLLKRFNYAFRYKLLNSPTGSDATYAAIDFMFDRSAVKIVRAEDKRKSEERVYRVILEGFNKEKGLRRPQPYYVLEKQEGVAGYPLNGSSELQADPFVVTSVQTYKEVFNVDPQEPGAYVTYLTQSSRARDVFTNNVAPDRDNDYPELTEDPADSVTKVALEAFKARPGVWFSAPLAPSVTSITIKTSSSVSTEGIRIGLRRPSVIRASGHTWEWTGYLNYDTAFPSFQGEPLERDFALGKIIVEEGGGRVYATGMNEEGNYYLGTTVFDLRSGEQFSIPLAAEGELGGLTNQVLNNVIVRNTLLMQDGSNLVMGRGTSLFFSNDTQFKSLTTGDIVASKNPPQVYASTSKAGLVQLADSAMIRGAKSAIASGISDKAVVTAYDLANELDVRFTSSVAGGNGVTVTTSSVELPGGDPADPTDNVTQFSINVGLPLNNQTVAFNGIRLGSTSGQEVTSIVNSSTGVDVSNASNTKLVTERALVDRFVNTTSAQTIAGAKSFTSNMSIQGELTVTGDITAFFTSDQRLKKNVTRIDNALSKVCQISGNTYTWNTLSGKEGEDVGVIAQEIREILPQAVTVRENGYLAVSYQKIVPLLIESIKSLKEEVDSLKLLLNK